MDELTALVKQTCQHPRGSIERQKGLHEIIWRIQQSGKLFRGTGVPDAEEALQKTWLYFCLNLCEATTSEEPYNSSQGSVITWLNAYLRYRLKDIVVPDQKIIHYSSDENGEEVDPTDLIPARPEPPPILEEIQEWLKKEAHTLRRIYVTNRPDINCLVLIERRLPPETSWKDLSQEFGVSIATLSGFYQRHCFPRLLNFGISQGYIDHEYELPK
ncbi:sigma-70 family RNA polymerase sigma factor [Nostoc parmelioides]|uniref:Sigma-70 family RNA polymerase sigma factor n=1 Tax=Nostoc parmelioides FACHB-3921 TaxID=2692909 RepID=A0ABR8B7M5_9NOSO|nr:sigma-70 family RNA polymerase sigma factor [Nostoc parmelioides]MBD2250122.1 sigma-70 family RNA polymerase sigma factor [Nostoc parmelioides FACHB-3921]